MNYKKHFKTHGYVHIPGVLSEDEVTRLRCYLDEIFKGPEYGQKRMLTPRSVLGLEKIYSLSFLPQVVKALKEVFGPSYTMFCDFQLHRNVFGGPTSWHTDSGSEIPNDYLLQEDYFFAKCGIYLQDNLKEWGGGIDVVPKGHRFPLKVGQKKWKFKAKTAYNEIGKKLWPKTLPIKKGDFIFFDSRLPHRATTPVMSQEKSFKNAHCQDIPVEHTKYVLYWNSSSSDQYVEKFLTNSQQRLSEEPADEPFFADYLSLNRKEEFPADFISFVRKNNLQVATCKDL